MAEQSGAKSALERHAQTVIGGLAFAVLTWVGFTLLDVKDRVTRIETRQLVATGNEDRAERKYEELERRVRQLESSTSGR